MLQRGDAAPRFRDLAQIERGPQQTRIVMIELGDSLAPGPDNDGVPPGLATVRVQPALGRSEDETPGLDGTGPQEDIPVGAPGRLGEGSGDGQDLRPGLGQSPV